jgi:uncharacterized protein YehS (DUF1456 family)
MPMPNKPPVVLFFGYPTGYYSVGGLIWTKRVADYVDSCKKFRVKKINNNIVIDRIDIAFPLRYLYDAARAIFTNPDISILNFTVKQTFFCGSSSDFSNLERKF